MRKIDKKNNLNKANLLIERRYLESKLIKEEKDINLNDLLSGSNSSVEHQIEIIGNMVLTFGGFDKARNENVKMLNDAIQKKEPENEMVSRFRINYMDNNRDTLEAI